MSSVLLPEWVWTPDGLRTNCAVITDAGRIVGLDAAKRHPDGDRLPRTLLLPGFVNAHSHAFQRAFRGRVQQGDGDDDFWSWRQAMYGVAGSLGPEGVEAVSRLAFLEMAEAGITRVGEFHYLHHQPDGQPYADPDELAHRVLAAAADVGVRMTLLRVAYARNAPGEPATAAQQRFIESSPDRVVEAVLRLKERVGEGNHVGLAPHSVRAVPPEWLPVLASWRGVVHAHVSEQPAENGVCMAENGCSPTELLARSGLVHERFTAVHLTHPLAGDVDRLGSLGAAVCVCPSTELDLGDGFYPLAGRALRLCVGSDSQAVIEPLAEARAIELHARGLAGRRLVMGDTGLAERLLRIATVDGERCLGGEGAGIAPGAPADFVALDLDRPAADGVPPLEAAAFVATPDWVSGVWVGGKRIVTEGKHPDRARIRAAASAWLS